MDYYNTYKANLRVERRGRYYYYKFAVPKEDYTYHVSIKSAQVLEDHALRDRFNSAYEKMFAFQMKSDVQATMDNINNILLHDRVPT